MGEQRSKGGGVVLLIVSQGSREERGPDGVDIARGEHGDDGVRNTAPRAMQHRCHRGDGGQGRAEVSGVEASSPPGRGVRQGRGQGSTASSGARHRAVLP